MAAVCTASRVLAKKVLSAKAVSIWKQTFAVEYHYDLLYMLTS